MKTIKQTSKQTKWTERKKLHGFYKTNSDDIKRRLNTGNLFKYNLLAGDGWGERAGLAAVETGAVLATADLAALLAPLPAGVLCLSNLAEPSQFTRNG